MIYSYPADAAKRFDEVFVYRDTDFQKSVEGYRRIIEDYAHDSGVLSKAYYFLAEALALQLDIEGCEEACYLSIEHGKKSGNIRCQNLALIKLIGIKLEQHNEAIALEFLYEALGLITLNQDEDLFDIIYMVFGTLFELAEDYDTALDYYNRSFEKLLELYPDVKESSTFIYVVRMLTFAGCYIKNNDKENLLRCYKELQEVSYENVPSVLALIPDFLGGYLAFLDGEKDKATTILWEVIQKYKDTEEVFDTYIIPEHIYKVFETYKMRDEQKVILDLMKKYNDTTDVDSWQVLYTETQIRYCRDIGDKEGLLSAYEKYYTSQQNYHNNSVKQKQEYIMLRKRLHEEKEEHLKDVETLQSISSTDALTKLENRYSLMRYAPVALQSAIMRKQQYGVLLIDVDRYKEFNDTYGHVRGDECLEQIGSVLKEVMKDHFCARYGGDEFIGIFTDADEEEIRRICLQIKEKLDDLNLEHVKNTPYGRVTVSQGFYTRVPVEGDDFTLFLKEADNGLYKSKERGRNCTTSVEAQ